MANMEHMIFDTGEAWGSFRLTDQFGAPNPEGDFNVTIATFEFKSKLAGWEGKFRRTSTGTYTIIVKDPSGREHTELSHYSYDFNDGLPVAVADFNATHYLGKCLVNVFAQLMTSGTTQAKMHNDATQFVDNEHLTFNFR